MYEEISQLINYIMKLGQNGTPCVRGNSLALLFSRLWKQKMNGFYMAYYTNTRLFEHKQLIKVNKVKS